MQTNILFTGDIIYWWLNNTGEIIYFLNALFGSMQPVWAQHSVRVRRSLNLWEQSPPTAHLICRESRMKLFLRHKDLHAYGKICESVHKTASANKICKRKRNFAKV